MAVGTSERQRAVYQRGDRSERLIGFIQLMKIRNVEGWRFVANRLDVSEKFPKPAVAHDTLDACFAHVAERMK